MQKDIYEDYYLLFKLYELLEGKKDEFIELLYSVNTEYLKLEQEGDRLKILMNNQNLEGKEEILTKEAVRTVSKQIFQFVDTMPYRYLSLFSDLAFQIDKSERLDNFPLHITKIQTKIEAVKNLLLKELQNYQGFNNTGCHL